jgi:hypothetical protein
MRRSKDLVRNAVAPIKRWTTIPLILFTIAGIAVLVYLEKNGPSLSPTLPSDMPTAARFAKASANPSSHQVAGIWIACNEDNDRHTDWCQLTDQSGAVVYKGDFLPVGSIRRAPQSELRIGHFDPIKGWVNGPNESFPVPVVPLADGTLLVPADETLELGAQWSGDPSQVEQLRASLH